MSLLDNIVSGFYDKIMELDSKDAIYIRGETRIQVKISLDEVENLSEIVLSNLKITSEIITGVIRKEELGLTPQKGDKLVFEGKTYILLPLVGKDFFTYVDTSRVVFKIAAYKEDS